MSTCMTRCGLSHVHSFTTVDLGNLLIAQRPRAVDLLGPVIRLSKGAGARQHIPTSIILVASKITIVVPDLAHEGYQTVDKCTLALL